MSIFVSHVPFTRLVDLVEGRVADSERPQIINHLTTCAHCQAEFIHLERLIGLMRGDVSEDAPAAVLARAVRIFQPSPATSNLFQRVVAALHFDSAHLAPALGVRSTPESQRSGTRQLLYGTAEHELDLRITPTSEGWIVSGQVLSPTPVERIELHGIAGVAQARFNDLSEFTLAPTPPGVYQLVVYLANIAVEVNALAIGV